MKKLSLGIVCILIFLASCNKEEIADQKNPQKKEIKLYAQKSTEIGTKGIALKDNLWEPGQTIRIKFMQGSGTDAQRKSIEKLSREWLKYVNLKFEYVGESEPADIRIGIEWKGDKVTWSHIGKDALNVPNNFPTINFAKLPKFEPAMKGDVLMQFGHVLGLVNEHKRKDNPSIFDKDIVYDYFTNAEYHEDDYKSWTIQEVNEFFFKPYSDAITNHTDTYDSKSIMVWPVEDWMTTNSNAQNQNKVLSELDKEFISSLYDPSILIFEVKTQWPVYIYMPQILRTENFNEIVKVDFGKGDIYEGEIRKIEKRELGTGIHTVKIYGKKYSLNLTLNESISEYLKSCHLGSATFEVVSFYNLSQSPGVVYPMRISIFDSISFIKSPKIEQTNAYGMFAGTKIREIPSGLLDSCTNTIDFTRIFSHCFHLQKIPDNLFENCTAAQDFTFAFFYDYNITSAVPKLWETHPNLPHERCFWYCEKAENYSDIPTDWK